MHCTILQFHLTVRRKRIQPETERSGNYLMHKVYVFRGCDTTKVAPNDVTNDRQAVGDDKVDSNVDKFSKPASERNSINARIIALIGSAILARVCKLQLKGN